MRRSLLATFLGVAMLSACGGGGANAPTTTSIVPAGSSMITLNLKIPPKNKQAHVRVRRGPKYVSPATLGLGINYAAGSATFTAAQIATPQVALDLSVCNAASNCVANPDGSSTYTLSLALAANTYTFEVTTWDAAPSTGTFSGHMLSQQILPSFVVAAGSASTPLNLSLNGLPASLSLVPLGVQSHVAQKGVGTYQIIGNAPVQFVAGALDADGYLITGAGVPTLTAVDSLSQFTFSSSASSNVLTVQVTPTLATSTPTNDLVTVTASDASSGTTSATAQMTLVAIPEMWISTNGGSGNFGVYGTALTGSQYHPSAQPTIPPLEYAQTTAADANQNLVLDDHGVMWVASGSPATTLQQYSATTGTTPPTKTGVALSGFSNIVDLRVSNGLLWVVDATGGPSGLGQISAYAEPGMTSTSTPVFTVTGAGDPNIANPVSLAPVPSIASYPSGMAGGFWVATASTITVFTKNGSSYSDATGTYNVQFTTPFGYPFIGLTIGTDGVVWGSYSGSGTEIFTPSVAGGTITLTQKGGEAIYSVGQGFAMPSGEVWVGHGSSSYNDVGVDGTSGCPTTCVFTTEYILYPTTANVTGVWVTP